MTGHGKTTARIAALQQGVIVIAHRVAAVLASAAGVAEGTSEKLLEWADAQSE